MKPFFCRFRKKNRGCDGFNLVEATLSVGLMSFGLLTLAPLLGLGLKTARLAQNDRATAEIAQTQMEEARQGTLAGGTTYLDFQGNSCASAQAAYTAQTTFASVTGNAFLTRLTLRITPLGAPDRARTYAVVYSTSP